MVAGLTREISAATLVNRQEIIWHLSLILALFSRRPPTWALMSSVDFKYEMTLIGLHGSLTPREMQIPILVG